MLLYLTWYRQDTPHDTNIKERTCWKTKKTSIINGVQKETGEGNTRIVVLRQEFERRSLSFRESYISSCTLLDTKSKTGVDPLQKGSRGVEEPSYSSPTKNHKH